MNNKQLKEKLARGDNLRSIYALESLYGDSIPVKKLKDMLDAVLEEQKEWVKATESRANSHSKKRVVSIPKVKDSSLKRGDYVFASCWSNASPSDPWIVGFVDTVTSEWILVRTDLKTSNRRWSNAMKISPEVGQSIVDTYPSLEGQEVNRKQKYAIFNP